MKIQRDHLAKILKEAQKEWDRLRAEGDPLPHSVFHVMADAVLELIVQCTEGLHGSEKPQSGCDDSVSRHVDQRGGSVARDREEDSSSPSLISRWPS